MSTTAAPPLDPRHMPQFRDWRRASGFADVIAPGCSSCRVQMDTTVCKAAAADCQSCPIARGRFRAVLRAASPRIGEQYHLRPAIERHAQQEGIIAKLQLERVALIRRGEATKAIDEEIKEAAKLASKYLREAGVAGNMRAREPEYDTTVFSE